MPGLLTAIMENVPREEWGAAWLACKPEDAPHIRHRWRLRRIDLYRAENGRRRSRHPLTNCPLPEPTIGPDPGPEERDAIAYYRGQCRSRREALLVDCVSSGLTYAETGAALGVGESRVSQLVAGLRFITVARTV